MRIDVEVTDRSGKAVKGLQARQFSITDDGKAQTISIFTYEDIEAIEAASEESSKPIVIPVDAPTASAAAAAGEQARDRRMLALYFDLTSLATEDLIRAHDAAEKFVKQQMTKADLAAVIVFGTRLTVLADFTNDRAKLEKAIAQLTPDAASQLSNPLNAAAQNGEYDVQEYTGAAYTADETEFNVFNTDQKLIAIEGFGQRAGRDSGAQIRH